MVLPTEMPTKTIYDGLGISPHFVYTFNESHAFSGKKECLVHKFLMDLWVDFAYKVRKHKTQKLLTLTNVNYLGMLPIYVYYLLLVHISNSMQIFPDLHIEYLHLISSNIEFDELDFFPSLNFSTCCSLSNLSLKQNIFSKFQINI